MFTDECERNNNLYVHYNIMLTIFILLSQYGVYCAHCVHLVKLESNNAAAMGYTSIVMITGGDIDWKRNELRCIKIVYFQAKIFILLLKRTSFFNNIDGRAIRSGGPRSIFLGIPTRFFPYFSSIKQIYVYSRKIYPQKG